MMFRKTWTMMWNVCAHTAHGLQAKINAQETNEGEVAEYCIGTYDKRLDRILKLMWRQKLYLSTVSLSFSGFSNPSDLFMGLISQRYSHLQQKIRINHVIKKVNVE